MASTLQFGITENGVMHTDELSRLGQISTEFIAAPDYGAGHGYPIFDQSVACARWPCACTGAVTAGFVVRWSVAYV